MSKRIGQKGFVLAFSAILLLSISFILAGFIALLVVNSRSMSTELSNAKAFWLAEAGIQQVAYKLKNDLTYSAAPANLNGSLGDGTYSVAVSTPVSSAICLVTSTGTVGDITRTISQTLTMRSLGWQGQFENYGVFAGTGNSNVTLKNKAIVKGDTYAGGTVRTQDTSSVTGTVYAASGTGNYTRQPLPDPPVTMPAFDKKWYDSVIATASTYPQGAATYSSLDLTGKIIYVNGKVTLANVTGSGTIVNTGNLVVSGSVGSNVTIISNGTVSIGANTTIAHDAMLYGRNSVEATNPGIATSNATLFSPGTVSIAAGASISGVVFCGGNVTLSAGAVVTGSVAAGGTVTIDSASVVQDKNQLPQQTPFGMVGKSATVVFSDWKG